MSRPQRVVLDNNIVISRMLYPHGTAATVFDLVFASCLMLMSAVIFEELEEVIQRAKFDRYLDLEDRREFIKRYAAATRSVTVDEAVSDCRDIQDNHVLALALVGRADVIVTGDADLVCLHPWREISILTPTGFLGGIR
jgi:putative PIN family toxin of toxin-antitoxin system